MYVHQRVLARRHKSADFREPRSLENFDFSFNPSINRAQIYELATCSLRASAPRRAPGRPAGCRKKSFGSSHRSAKHSRPASVVLYRSIFDLVRELLTQETLAGEGRLLNKYLKPDLLIID